jgi:hypothetical protein
MAIEPNSIFFARFSLLALNSFEENIDSPKRILINITKISFDFILTSKKTAPVLPEAVG